MNRKFKRTAFIFWKIRNVITVIFSQFIMLLLKESINIKKTLWMLVYFQQYTKSKGGNRLDGEK